MTKKEISTYLRKFFGYSPTSREIIYYELKNVAKKEADFTPEDNLEVHKERDRQYPSQYPSKPIKILERIVLTRRDIASAYRRAVVTTNKERVEYIKKYHSDRGMEIPPELKQVIKKYE